MNSLVPYKQGILVPTNSVTASLVYLLTPNKLDYEGNAAIALTNEDLWICTPGQEFEKIPFQNMRRASEQNFTGFTRRRSDGVYVSPRDAWGVVVEYKRLGEFTYSMKFLTFHQANAIDWVNQIERLIALEEERGFEEFRPEKRNSE